MSEFLKGNFKVKKEVEDRKDNKKKNKKEEIKKEFKDQAMASIGGSMVYVERTDLTWDGDESDDETTETENKK